MMNTVNDFKCNALRISYFTERLIFVRWLARRHEFVNTPCISCSDLPAWSQRNSKKTVEVGGGP